MKMNVKEFVKAVAERSGKTQKELNEIMSYMDDVVREVVGGATEDDKAEIKILPSGVTVVSEYVPAHEAKNPQDGTIIQVPGKNRVRAKIGKGLKDAANE